MMSENNVDLSFLAKQVQTVLDETRQVRKELADVRTLTLQTYEFARRVERRQSELRDDLEVVINAQFGGSFANLQTSVENSLHRIEEKVGDLTDRVMELEQKP